MIALFEPNTVQNADRDEALNAFFDQIQSFETERAAATDAGLPALQRLAAVAQRDTGQSATVRRFLLGLYNGYRWPFNLTSMRSLDKALFDDCIAVLTLDARATEQEVHRYLGNGDDLFEFWAKMEG